LYIVSLSSLTAVLSVFLIPKYHRPIADSRSFHAGPSGERSLRTCPPRGAAYHLNGTGRLHWPPALPARVLLNADLLLLYPYRARLSRIFLFFIFHRLGPPAPPGALLTPQSSAVSVVDVQTMLDSCTRWTSLLQYNYVGAS